METEQKFDIAPTEGYAPEIGLLLASLEDGTREWLRELGDLDEEGLVWRPFPDGPSIGSLMMHIAWVERMWIEATLTQKEPPDDFRKLTLVEETDVDAGKWGEAPRMPFDDYLAVLADVRRTTRETLAREKDSARTIVSEPGAWGDTVRWIVSHVVQHEAYHGGQAVLVKRMYRGSMW